MKLDLTYLTVYRHNLTTVLHGGDCGPGWRHRDRLAGVCLLPTFACQVPVYGPARQSPCNIEIADMSAKPPGSAWGGPYLWVRPTSFLSARVSAMLYDARMRGLLCNHTDHESAPPVHTSRTVCARYLCVAFEGGGGAIARPGGTGRLQPQHHLQPNLLFMQLPRWYIRSVPPFVAPHQ